VIRSLFTFDECLIVQLFFRWSSCKSLA